MSFSVNLNDHEVSDNDVLPAGEYPLTLLEWEDVETKNGRALKCQFTVTEGSHDNRRLFTYFNYQNTNAQAEQIAGGELKAWAIACGMAGTESLSEEVMEWLVGKPFIGKVKVRPSKDPKYGDDNTISKYMPVADFTAPSAPPAPAAPSPAPGGTPTLTQPAPAPVAPAAEKPWER